ncbi:hypothetical protein SRHO_G00123180 [Serrasalmus rhombeus]
MLTGKIKFKWKPKEWSGDNTIVPSCGRWWNRSTVSASEVPEVTRLPPSDCCIYICARLQVSVPKMKRTFQTSISKRCNTQHLSWKSMAISARQRQALFCMCYNSVAL